MNGAVELFTAARKHGIKPILGCEIYVVDDHSRRAAGRLDRFHLTLLAATPTGYRNLVKLSSAGFLEGYQRGKPSVDLAQMAAHAEGVIALTGCLQSRFCQHLLGRPARRGPRARRRADAARSGAENVYFEVQKNGLAGQDKVNEGVVRIARELGRPLVAHRRRPLPAARGLPPPRRPALRADQVDARASPRSASRPTSSTCARARRWRRRSREWPEAIASTLEIAERCDVELELGRQLIPRYPTPDGGERARVPARARATRACAAATATRRPPRRSSEPSTSSG